MTMGIRNKLLEEIRNLLAGGSTSLSVEYTNIVTFASTATQSPTGLGSAGKVQVSFGAGGTTSGGEFTIDPDGTINTNLNGIQYTFDIVIRPARLGASGISIVMARFLYSADGTRTDTVQVGDTFSVEIDNANTIWRESFNGTFSPAVGSQLWLEVARDEAGDDSGELRADQPTGTLVADAPAWNQVATARVEISKLSVVPS